MPSPPSTRPRDAIGRRSSPFVRERHGPSTVLVGILARDHKPLASITTEDVQQFKSTLSARSPKTVNNILTVLNVLMRIAVEWDVIERVPCVIKMLKAPKSHAAFYDFDQFERLVERARMDRQPHLVVLLGGEAGLRCGEMIGLEWLDIDLEKRPIVCRSIRVARARRSSEG
jgi:integrase